MCTWNIQLAANEPSKQARLHIAIRDTFEITAPTQAQTGKRAPKHVRL